jgi:hypothetical protein
MLVFAVSVTSGFVVSTQIASNVTVLQFIDVKFLKLVSLVISIILEVVVWLPYVCSTLSIPVIFHPENVYPALVGLLHTVNAVL